MHLGTRRSQPLSWAEAGESLGQQDPEQRPGTTRKGTLSEGGSGLPRRDRGPAEAHSRPAGDLTGSPPGAVTPTPTSLGACTCPKPRLWTSGHCLPTPDPAALTSLPRPATPPSASGPTSSRKPPGVVSAHLKATSTCTPVPGCVAHGTLSPLTPLTYSPSPGIRKLRPDEGSPASHGFAPRERGFRAGVQMRDLTTEAQKQGKGAGGRPGAGLAGAPSHRTEQVGPGGASRVPGDTLLGRPGEPLCWGDSPWTRRL